uniref:Gypsy retrotransposon integrase-like protein 1 n=1 Tax=Latimeria chalumnae TaxID=7897 RepID=H3APU4_LATCH
SSSKEEHLLHLEALLETLFKAGLKVNPDKAQIVKDCVSFLGITITPSGRALDRHKLKVLLALPLPTDLTSLRSFLGMCNFMRSLVWNFSALCKPLYQLLKSQQPFLWIESHTAAVMSLKTALTSAPTLSSSDYTLPFHLFFTSTITSLVVVMAQLTDAWHPLAFASRLTSVVEQKYTPCELALLAVHWALQHFLFLTGTHEARKGKSLSTLMLKVKAHDRSNTYNCTVANIHSRGHFAADATYRALKVSFWWPKMREQIEHYCAHCLECAMINPAPRQVVGPLPIRAVSGPWRSIFMDYIDGLPRAPGGHTHLLVVVCAFTKWVEAFPMTTTTAKATAKILLWLFSTWGIPDTVDSDRGPQFANEVMEQTLAALGVKHHLHIPYRPQASEQMERVNCTLKAGLKKVCLEQGAHWADALPWLLMALRSRVDKRTGYSPFQIMMGRVMRLPENLLYTPASAEEAALVTTEVWVEQLIATCRKIHTAVAHRMGDSKRKVKAYFDASAGPVNLEIGDQVMLKKFSDKGPFPQAAYAGPFSIVDRVSPTVY